MSKKRFAANIQFLLVALLIGFLVSLVSIPTLESLSLDARFRTKLGFGQNNQIVLVLADKSSQESAGHPVTLEELEKASRIVSKNSLLTITYFAGLDVAPNSLPQLVSKFATDLPSNMIVAIDSFSETKNSFITQKANGKTVNFLSAPLTSDISSFAADSVSRRTMIRVEDSLVGAGFVAKVLNPLFSVDNVRGAFNYKGSSQVFTNYDSNDSFTTYHISDILQGKVDPNMLNNKVVIIGRDDFRDTGDYLKTPFSRDTTAMPKAEVFANSLATILENKGLITPPQYVNQIITILVSALIFMALFSLRPTQGLLALLGLAVSFCATSWLCFNFLDIAITMTNPLLTIIISYYVFIPYRLIQESRKSWEYQEKNRLLTQVEELKTNFLSMMSHDLKTPLARIQGMTDIALAAKENLSPSQEQALKTISQSTEELSNFISGILDLSRVESQAVKLQIHSKDINALLDETIKKYDFQARQKDIQFVKEFEPLFSVKIDAELMKQVFANLIENAIKYSPEGSKVLVTTEEINGQIVVQVADQGIGIPSDELNNVFMKFYRSKEVKNTPLKGSGLGLFLAKYFVELHKGNISVESVPKQGSTFTVQIPMQ